MTSTKKKLRIFATLVAMVLVLLMMSMGIYAAKSIDATASGMVSLSGSQDVLASVSIDKKVSTESLATSGIITRNYDRSFQEGEAQYSETYALGNVQFIKVSDFVDYDITVTNNFGTNTDVKVTVNTGTINSPLKMEMLYKGDDNSETPLEFANTMAIAQGQSYKFTVRISIDASKITATEKQNGFKEVAFNFEMLIESGATLS